MVTGFGMRVPLHARVRGLGFIHGSGCWSWGKATIFPCSFWKTKPCTLHGHACKKGGHRLLDVGRTPFCRRAPPPSTPCYIPCYKSPCCGARVLWEGRPRPAHFPPVQPRKIGAVAWQSTKNCTAASFFLTLLHSPHGKLQCVGFSLAEIRVEKINPFGVSIERITYNVLNAGDPCEGACKSLFFSRLCGSLSLEWKASIRIMRVCHQLT